MSTVSVRRASEDDMREVWEWWNDPVTRQMMKKNDHVPWEEHVAWYEKVLIDPNRLLLMGLGEEGQKLGVVRFDLRDPQTYEVSINVNPLFRGKGLGSALINAGILVLLDDRPVRKLWAGCKKINQASKRSFEKAGFCVVPHAARESEGEYYLERFFAE